MNASGTRYQTRNKWRTLLTGRKRQEAEETLHGIAASLATLLGVVSAGESANLALFFGYMAEAYREEKGDAYRDLAFAYLNNAIDRASHDLDHPYLCGGYAGLGWVIANLAGKVLEQSESENCESVDEALIEILRAPGEQIRYELLYGLAGLGVYALERLPHSSGIEILQLVIAQLMDSVRRIRPGLTWFTRPEQLPESQRLIWPNGYYNLGVAHGVPGVLPMLARACAVEQTRSQAWELLSGAQAWLQAQQLRNESGTSFPHWLTPEIEPEPGRLAWCYGSLGAATAWLDAARRTGQSAWEREALTMLRCAARTPLADSAVRDAGLCHGAAGNAHIFNRLYQATGEEIFKLAALQWYEHTLILRRPGIGLAGFQAWAPAENGDDGWETRSDFLDGVAGIGLALLAGCTDQEPEWDRLLAISVS